MCFSYISTLLKDLSENAIQILIYLSVNCKYPCHKCLITNNNLNNLELSNNQIVLRTSKMMKIFVKCDLMYQYSIYNMRNIFWDYL